MLTSAYISHYKSIAETRLNFGRENVVVGANGVGKSNLVDALYFIRDAAKEDLDYAVTKRHGIESIRQWSRTRPFNITIDLSFKTGNAFGSYKTVLSSARGMFKVEEESGYWNGPSIYFGNDKSFSRSFTLKNGKIHLFSEEERYGLPTDLPASPSELFLSQISSRAGSIASLFFNELSAEAVSFGAYAIYPNTIRTPQSVSNEEVLADNGSNLASIIKRMSTGTRRRSRESLLDALKVILPIVDNIEVRSAGGFYVPVLRVQEPGGDIHDLNMSQISDGTLRMLGLLTAFYQPSAPRKIALEEPEQMIHPGILAVLVDAARDYVASDDENQLFLTTHSPNLLDLFSSDDIIRVEFKDGITQAGPIIERQKELIRDRLFSPGELLVAEGFME